MSAFDDMPQEMYDRLLNDVLTKAQSKGALGQALAAIDENGDTEFVGRSQERHAARQRAKGEKGW